VSTDVGYDRGAALRRAADGVQPPLIDLAAIKRGGRRRRLRARAAACIVVVFVAGVAGVLLATAPRGYGHTGSPAVASEVRIKTIAHVRAFYHAYALAQIGNTASVKTLVSTYATVWYTPILQTAVASTANPVGCAEHSLSVASMEYEWVGVLGGQAVVLTRWRTAARQIKYNVVSATPRTAAITGITCVSAGRWQATPAVRDAPVRFYTRYIGALKAGTPPRTELTMLRGSEPLAASPYLRQLITASPSLSYDPVLCERGGLPERGWAFSVARSPRYVAGQAAALVVVRPQAKAPILTVVQNSARGFAVTNVACPAA
jgi:hypothetical protein